MIETKKSFGKQFEELEKISITGALSMKDVSFYDVYLQSRVRNFNGEIYFNHVPKENQKQAIEMLVDGSKFVKNNYNVATISNEWKKLINQTLKHLHL